MSRPEPVRPLIRNKAVATFALCFTALCTVQDFRNALIPPSRHPQWLLDLRFLHFVPNWAAITINLFFYAYFLWIAIEVPRMGQGTERFLLGGFGAAVFLGVVTNLVPASTLPLIRDVHAALMAVALAILVEIFTNNNPAHESDASQ